MKLGWSCQQGFSFLPSQIQEATPSPSVRSAPSHPPPPLPCWWSGNPGLSLTQMGPMLSTHDADAHSHQSTSSSSHFNTRECTLLLPSPPNPQIAKVAAKQERMRSASRSHFHTHTHKPATSWQRLVFNSNQTGGSRAKNNKKTDADWLLCQRDQPPQPLLHLRSVALLPHPPRKHPHLLVPRRRGGRWGDG